jgi:hypothetical protein
MCSIYLLVMLDTLLLRLSLHFTKLVDTSLHSYNFKNSMNIFSKLLEARNFNEG